MADKNEMTRDEFTEYMQAFEERLNARFKSIDERFSSVDERLTSVDEQFTSIDKRFTSIDGSFKSLEHSMKVQFEDTRSDIRLSLEAVQGLRETTERGFADMRAEHAEQTSLLQTAVKHVRRRVERVERRRN